MYLDHLGLHEAPFTLPPHPGFYFGLPAHEEALQVLRWAIGQGEGFIKVTGEVGTGKTLLCRKLMEEGNLGDQEVRYVWLPNPHLLPCELKSALASALDMPRPEGWQQDLTGQLHQHLIQLQQAGVRVVVVMDEAQALPDYTLEALRLLGNLDSESHQLLQVVLFGQPELNRRLAEDNLRQLRQRIAFACALRPLCREEAQAYVEHRLYTAGYRGAPLFTKLAHHHLWRAARGVPRLLNILAHKSMMLAYGEGERLITPRLVSEAIRDTEDTRLASGWRQWLQGSVHAMFSIWGKNG
ncbi:ExeA family protein [Aeromonas simiae]|uniref:ExeA family protein n=1 Tax=Aeromonas simiae TaxID=218936 RepID=UPI00345E4D2D